MTYQTSNPPPVAAKSYIAVSVANDIIVSVGDTALAAVNDALDAGYRLSHLIVAPTPDHLTDLLALFEERVGKLSDHEGSFLMRGTKTYILAYSNSLEYRRRRQPHMLTADRVAHVASAWLTLAEVESGTLDCVGEDLTEALTAGRDLEKAVRDHLRYDLALAVLIIAGSEILNGLEINSRRISDAVAQISDVVRRRAAETGAAERRAYEKTDVAF